MDSTPSKDSTLVDPSSVAVLGPVEPTTSSSPAVPEKKSKKDKASSSSSSSKAKKPTKSAEDSKFDELDKKWTDRFNKLEALLLAKSLQPVDQPTFSAAVKVPPSRSPPATVNKDSEPFFQPVSSGRTGTDSSVSLHQSASPVRRRPLHLLSALGKTPLPLLLSICHPASLSPTRSLPDLLHRGALAKTLLLSTDLPASLHLTGTARFLILVLTLHSDILQILRSGLTGLDPLWPPTPTHHHCTDNVGIVLLVAAQPQLPTTLTDLLWTYMLRRVNYQRTRTARLMNPTRQSVKNRPIGKL